MIGSKVITHQKIHIHVAFMTMGKDSEKNDEVSLKEQLVFHYMQRSLLVLGYAKNLNPKSETDGFECIFILLCHVNIGISWHYSF